MIRIEQKNIKKAANVSIDLADKVTLLAGGNGAGKSSLCRTVKMALCGEFPKDAKLLLRTGCANATLKITDFHHNGTTRAIYEVSFPECKPITQGWPAASVYASGHLNFCEASKTDKSLYLQKLLKTEPTEIDLAKALKEREIITVNKEDPKSVEEAKKYTNSVWTTIQRKGWVNAHKEYEDRGQQYKRDWKAVTGETWGSNKANKWTPLGWEDKLAGKSKDTLMSEFTERQAHLEVMLRVEAVQQSEIERLQSESAKLHEIATKRDAAISKHEELKEKHKEMTAIFEKMARPAAQSETFDCWSCKSKIDKRTLQQPPAAQTPEEVEKINAALTEYEDQIKAVANDMALAQNNVLKYRLEFSTAENAGNALKALLDKQKNSAEKPSEAQIEEQRQRVEIARVQLEAWTKKNQADEHNRNIERNQKLIDLLKPDGWRQSFSTNALAILNNDYLKPQCEKAGIPLVEIDRSNNITYDGFAYSELSGGEQFITAAMFQIALARISNAQAEQNPSATRADLMVFDAADILEPEFRQGLMKLLSSLSIPSLVSMTYGKGKAPDLEANKLGVTHWLDKKNGEVTRYRQAVTV